MLDDFIDDLISRLMTGAGLIVTAAIAAVTGAMAIFAFLEPHVGRAWAYVAVTALAGITVAVWSLSHKRHRARHRRVSLEQRIVDLVHAHPSGAFIAGLAAGVAVKGKPWEALAILKARPKAKS